MSDIMRRFKPKVRDFNDQAIIILEKQKNDKNFTRYAKAILTERYLGDNISLYELSKKLNKSRSDFQKEILWDVITTKLLVEKNSSEIIRIYYVIEKLPIDYLVKLSQEASDSLVKERAEKVCYEKQLELEKELGLDTIDYEKYLQDEDYCMKEDNKENLTKNKSKIPKKDQFDLSVTTRKFLRNFYGIAYDEEEKLSHKEMEHILIREGIPIPKRGRIQNISCEQVLVGRWVLVRDEVSKRRNFRIIPYMNPVSSSMEELLMDAGISYKKRGGERL